MNCLRTFNIRITLRGESWDGYVDYRIGKFIINFQHDVLKTYNSATGNNLSLKNSIDNISELLIKAEVRQGSADILLKMKSTINRLIDNTFGKMNGGQVVATLISGMLITGAAWTTPQVLEKINKHAEKTEDEITKQKLIALAEKIEDNAKQNQTALTTIISNMQTKDTIQFNNTKELDKKEALKRIDKKERTAKELTYLIDDKYLIIKLDLEAGSITLRSTSGRSFTASTKTLPESDKIELHKNITDADLNEVIPGIELQVSAVISEGKLVEAYVTKLGNKRIDSTTLVEALRKTGMKSKKITQATLPY